MFWERFNYLCAKKGISANAAAKELSIASGTVSEWKKGRVPLNSTLKKIANYFDVPVDFLLDKENMFWKNYLKLCKDKGLSPNAVAKGLNVSSGSVTEWKKGRIPSKKTLQKLAEHFNVTIEYFFIDHSESKSETKKEPESNQHIFISYSNKGSEKENELGLNLTTDQTEKLKEILKRFNKLPEDKQDDYLDMFDKMLKMNDTND